MRKFTEEELEKAYKNIKILGYRYHESKREEKEVEKLHNAMRHVM